MTWGWWVGGGESQMEGYMDVRVMPLGWGCCPESQSSKDAIRQQKPDVRLGTFQLLGTATTRGGRFEVRKVC